MKLYLQKNLHQNNSCLLVFCNYLFIYLEALCSKQKMNFGVSQF